jgi:hypothetical protein
MNMERSGTLCRTLTLLLVLSACGGGGGDPTSPSTPSSFLTGTWRGTLTIQPDPTAPQPPAPISGEVTWTFEVVPQTNAQTFRATVQSANGWLPITLTGSTAITPSNTPPAQISTLGDYASPRGCRGSFGSSGTAEATRIEADFTGVDCNATFTGRVVLTKG